MIRNLQLFGPMLAALVMTTAFAASPAQASEGVFTWESGTAKLLLEQDDEEGANQATGTQHITTAIGAFQCELFSGQAEATGTGAEEITVANLTYSDRGRADSCSGSWNWTFYPNGCHYTLTAGETIGQTGMETTGTTHIKCPEGKEISTTLGQIGCIRIPEQTPTGGHIILHTITAQSGKNYVTVEETLSGIHYNAEGICGSGLKTDGAIASNFVIKGFQSGGVQTGIEIH